MHKRLVALALSALLCIVPVLARADVAPAKKLFADDDTVTGASAFLFIEPGPVLPSGARRLPSNTMTWSLTIVWISGDPCYFNINPNNTAAVAGDYTDQVWVSQDNPVQVLPLFNVQRLQAMSDGTTHVWWGVLYTP